MSVEPGVIYRQGRPSIEDYNEAIAALRDAATQLEPDGRGCVVCHDSGHQAFECHHNPLVMARRAVGRRDSFQCFICGGVYYDHDGTALRHFGERDSGVPTCAVNRRRGDLHVTQDGDTFEWDRVDDDPRWFVRCITCLATMDRPAKHPSRHDPNRTCVPQPVERWYPTRRTISAAGSHSSEEKGQSNDE